MSSRRRSGCKRKQQDDPKISEDAEQDDPKTSGDAEEHDPKTSGDAEQDDPQTSEDAEQDDPKISEDAVSVSRSCGSNEPAHYMLKIESFSLLSEAGIQPYKFDTFYAAGHKWRLVLYPSGNEEENGDNHISLYLVRCHSGSLPEGWEVHVYFKFFVYDHIRHNYLTIRYADGKKRRFHAQKTMWGFPKAVSLDAFNDAANGYLFQDSCVFGAEVFAVPKYVKKDQCFSMIKPPAAFNTYTWTIPKFSTITSETLYSGDFKVGRIKWEISLYPRGNSSGQGTHLSIFLEVFDASSLPDIWRFYAKYTLRLKNQAGNAHEELDVANWFSNSTHCWGAPEFMLLSEIKDPENGFLVNDTLIVEAEVSHEANQAAHRFCNSTPGWCVPEFMLLSEFKDPERGFLVNDTLFAEAKILVVGMLRNFI